MDKIKITLVLDGENGEESREETLDEAQKFFSDPNFVHFIAMYYPPRSGVQACFEELEHTYFPPKKDINKDFIFRILEWTGAAWAIVSIPKIEFKLMEEVAKKNGLRPVNGTPHLFREGKIKPFPIKDSDNTFVLEGVEPGILVFGVGNEKKTKSK